jgi:hypothetical protein
VGSLQTANRLWNQMRGSVEHFIDFYMLKGSCVKLLSLTSIRMFIVMFIICISIIIIRIISIMIISIIYFILYLTPYVGIRTPSGGPLLSWRPWRSPAPPPAAPPLGPPQPPKYPKRFRRARRRTQSCYYGWRPPPNWTITTRQVTNQSRAHSWRSS